MNGMIEFGKRYRDTVSGFEGIALARTEYLTGCVHVELQGPVNDGKLPDAVWFDETRVVLSDEQPEEQPARPLHAAGGPSTPPPAHRHGR